MIHFKVIRASHLLLGLAILLLIVTLVLVGTRWMAQRQATPGTSTASLVDASAGDEAKTTQVFASSDNSGALPTRQNDKIEIEVVKPTDDDASHMRILIYHTHTHEAYEQVDGDLYEALEAWRTTDHGHSVVRVGEALASRLRRYGFDVVHDTTDHEGSELSTAYTRSLATLMNYRECFDLYIDLHRDAYVEGDPVSVTSRNGEEMAPVMLLIGNGNGFDVKPWYRQNLSFARALEARINEEAPGLCKPVLVKDGRYNQNIGVFSILVEVGHNRNTLAQACNSVSPLAKAIYSLLLEKPDPDLQRMKAAWEATYTSENTKGNGSGQQVPVPGGVTYP